MVPADTLNAVKNILRKGTPVAKQDVAVESSPKAAEEPESKTEPEVSAKAQETKGEGAEEGEKGPIPYDKFVARLSKEQSKLKSEKERGDKLERELADLRTKAEKARDSKEIEELLAPERKPKNYDDLSVEEQVVWMARQSAKQTVAQELGDYLPDVKSVAMQRRIAKALGSSISQDQAEAISSVLDEAPRLSPQDALVLAKNRNPELFGEQKGKALPPSHSVNEPKGGRTEPPVRDDHGRYVESFNKARNVHDRMKAAAAYVKASLKKQT